MVGDKLLSFQWGVKKIKRNQAIQGKRKTCAKAGLFSDEILCGDSGRTRTYNQLIKSQLLCQLSYGAKWGISYKRVDTKSTLCTHITGQFDAFDLLN